MTDLATAKAKLQAAKGPEEIFGEFTDADIPARLLVLGERFRDMARMLHPDRHGGDKSADEAMSLLNSLRDRAEKKIEAGTWGKPVSSTSIVTSKTYVNVTPFSTGDISDVYLGEFGVGERAVIKVARDPRDRDLLDNEAKVLTALFSKTDAEAVGFQRYLPKLIEETRLKVAGSDRATNVFAYVDGGYTLTEVVARHGDSLDPRHVAWIWKRLLEGIDWVHRQGFVHGGINPDHVLIFPKNHGIKILDWSYAAKSGSTLKAISKAHRAYYPTEVLAKKPLTFGADVFMIAKCVMAMLGGDVETGIVPGTTPRAYIGMIHASTLPAMHRYQDAFELYEQLKTHLRSLFGPAKFIEMTM